MIYILNEDMVNYDVLIKIDLTLNLNVIYNCRVSNFEVIFELE